MQQQLYVSSTSDAQTQADEQVASRSSQTVLTGEVIDVMTVDEVFDEAMDMLLVADRRILNAELQAHQLKREAELAAARLQASEAARLAVQADLAHERAARQVAEQVFAGEVATNESAVAAAAAAGSYCDLVDQFLRREEWLRRTRLYETVLSQTRSSLRRHSCTSGLHG